MCGRYSLLHPAAVLRERFKVDRLLAGIAPRFNIAPSQDVPVVQPGEQGRELVAVRWGLIPRWSKDGKPELINARAESVATKPAFRAALRHGRVLVPASGFYEWRPGPSGKQPYYIRARDGGPIAFAGITDTWARGPDGARRGMAILTMDASEPMARIHNRMPVILPPSAWSAWLGELPPGDLTQWLGTASEELEIYPVSTRVNRAAHDDPSLIEPLTDAGPLNG